MGGVYRPAYKTKSGDKIVSPDWWIYYSCRGKQIKENSHSQREADAWKLLKKRHGEIAEQKPVGPDITRTMFDDMAQMLVNDYNANGRKSVACCTISINHLRGYFGEDKVRDITSDRVTAYATMRQGEKASNSTINSELAALSKMFTLAIRAGKASNRPHIQKLRLNNTRKGFFEADQFNAVLGHMPDDLKPVMITAYVTGWRVHDEILTRQKHHLNLKAGWLRLEPGETKNNEGREFPLTPMLRETLEKQIAKTEAMQRDQGAIIPWLFHRNGKPIKCFRKAWRKACTAAGIPGRIPHDFRRTAVRNLERAGVPRSAAMKMVGHRTEAIYRRYAIVDAPMLKDAAVKLDQLHRADHGIVEQKVISLEK
jgi:integrase